MSAKGMKTATRCRGCDWPIAEQLYASSWCVICRYEKERCGKDPELPDTQLQNQNMKNETQKPKPKVSFKGWAFFTREQCLSGKYQSADEVLPVVEKRYPGTRLQWVRDVWDQCQLEKRTTDAKPKTLLTR